MGASLANSKSLPVYKPRLLFPASGGKSLSRRRIRLEISGGFPDRYRFSTPPQPAADRWFPGHLGRWCRHPPQARCPRRVAPNP